jgi:hypothetical protein
MIKEKASNSLCLGEEPLTKLERFERVIQGTSAIFLFKNLQNPKFLRRDCVSGIESKLFRLSITQDSVVDTLKFTSADEAGNNLYAGFISRR